MRIPHTATPVLRGMTVIGFVALCATIFSFLWLQAGGRIPLVSRSGYEVTVPLTDIDNLVFQSDVRIAGVEVGQIEKIDIDGRTAMVTLELDDSVVPLHDGAVITVRNKTMIEETYLEIRDGQGEAYPDGARLPADAARGSVQLNDVLSSLDGKTRQDLSGLIQSGGASLKGTRADVDAVMAGLGDLGSSAGAMEALADQSADLRSLVRTSTKVLDTLDVQQGRIVDLVRDAETVTSATSRHEHDIEALMRALPPLLDTTEEASAGLSRLAQPLGTVATNLRGASGDLDAALRELPATTSDLRGLLPSLDRTLTRAPDTLELLSPFRRAVGPLVETLQVNLADLNPMLTYMRPYGRDLVSYWANFTGFVSGSDANGPVARVKPVFSANSLNLGASLSPLTMYNPYPDPGAHYSPRDFTGAYPRIEEDPVPR
jgi:phospholipid/cholesterol/gamma-HCH transport system substrate-binding protein